MRKWTSASIMKTVYVINDTLKILACKEKGEKRTPIQITQSESRRKEVRVCCVDWYKKNKKRNIFPNKTIYNSPLTRLCLYSWNQCGKKKQYWTSDFNSHRFPWKSPHITIFPALFLFPERLSLDNVPELTISTGINRNKK